MSLLNMESRLRENVEIVTIVDEDLMDLDQQEIIQPKIASGLASNEKNNVENFGTIRILPALDRFALNTLIHNQIELKAGVTVELLDGTFMRIKTIAQETSMLEANIHGWIFERNRHMKGLDRNPNEVCWILHVREDDTREHSTQGMVSVAISKIKKERRLLMTNQPFPALNFRVDEQSPDIDRIESIGVLICRYKYVCIYQDEKDKKDNTWCERAYIRLRAAESDNSYGVSDEGLRQAWRGETVKGGACKGFLPGEMESIEEERQSMGRRRFRRSPTASAVLTRQESVPSLATSAMGMPKELIIPSASDLEEITEFKALSARNEGNSMSQPIHLDSAREGSKVFGARNEKGSSIARPIYLDSAQEGFPQQGKTVSNRIQTKLKFPPKGLTDSNVIDLTNEGQDRGPHSSLPGKANRPTQKVNTSSKRGTIRKQHDRRISSYFSRQQSSPREGDKRIRRDSVVGRTHNDETQPHRYTFGDGFCGAGGVSRGAVDAGLRVEWGFDSNYSACQSFNLNFFKPEVFNIRVDQFCKSLHQHCKVDICHLSPPCQPFSGAHTTAGKNDEPNTAALFSIIELLSKTTPRIVTLEETSGIISRHGLFFHSLINMFHTHGFSLRWRVLNLTDYGVPQTRKRLIVIASCPGEVLPEFPKQTHSPVPQVGLQMSPTINDAIADIPHNWPNHNVHGAPKRDCAPYDGNTQARCMTTAAPDFYHPDGNRAFTHRELACLQGFPLEHKFSAPGVKRQIGNAVPPIFAKKFLEEIKFALMRADGLL